MENLADRLFLDWTKGEEAKVRHLTAESGIILPRWHDFFIALLNREGMTVSS
jgi:hypothetical protein